MFFLNHCYQCHFLHWESQVHLTSLGCPPTLCWSLDLFVEAAQILIWSHSYVFLPPISTAIRTSVFSLWELSMTFYIFHRHRVCLVDHVDLICRLYSWWEALGSSSLATLPLGFNCGFISTSACGLSTGVCSWGSPGGLGFAPVRARCRSGNKTTIETQGQCG